MKAAPVPARVQTDRSADAAPSAQDRGRLPDAGRGERRFGHDFSRVRVHQSAADSPEAHFARAAGVAPHGVPYRSEMERAFGRDFSSVRTQLGGRAARTGLALLGASAAARGSTMVFADKAPSRRLVAHELSHVVQDANRGVGRTLALLTHEADAERQADAAAADVMARKPVVVGALPARRVHRQPASRDDEADIVALIEGATTIDELRAIDDAIEGAERDGANLVIVYNALEYIVAGEAYSRLIEKTAAKQSEVLAMSHPDLGLTLDERIDAAVAAGDRDQIVDLQLLIQSAVNWNEAKELESGKKFSIWRVALRTGEELKVEAETVRAALVKINKVAPKSIDQSTPQEVALQNLQLGFRIAGDRKLADGLWTGSGGSSVSVTLSRSELKIAFSPGLGVHKLLMRIATVNSVTLIFLTGAIRVDASRDNDAFKETVQETVEETIRNELYALLKGTAFEKAGYDPFADKALAKHLDEFKTKLSSGGGKTDDDQVGAADLSGFRVGAKLKLPGGFSQLDAKQTGLVVAPGAVFDMSIESAGSIAGGNLDSMKKLTLSTGGVALQSKGTQAVKLTRLRVNRGGSVTLEAFELLGGVKDAADIEQLGRMLGTMIGLGAAGVPDRAALDAAAGTNPKAELVEGLTKGMIEKQFTAAVQKLIRDNATAIPGVDLLKATGVQP